MCRVGFTSGVKRNRIQGASSLRTLVFRGIGHQCSQELSIVLRSCMLMIRHHCLVNPWRKGYEYVGSTAPASLLPKSCRSRIARRSVSMDRFVLNLLEHCRLPFYICRSQDNAKLRGHSMLVSNRSEDGPGHAGYQVMYAKLPPHTSLASS